LPEQIGRHWETTGRAMFSVSATGVLVYQEALPRPPAHIVVRNRAGDVLRTIEAPGGSQWPSPDPLGTHAAIQDEDENTVEDIWIMDLERSLVSRLTSRQGSNQHPVWSPDGRRIAFMSNRAGAYDLYARNADGSGADELLLKSPHTKFPACWSADGKYLVYTETGTGEMRRNSWVLPLGGDRRPIPFLDTGFSVDTASLSVPDSQGRMWMAYSSNETGSGAVYLRPFLPGSPGGPAGAAVRVSPGWGDAPVWRKDGMELFYHGPSLQEMAVDVKLANEPKIGIPHALFHIGYPAVSADGQRFITVESAGELPDAKISVVLNWTAELGPR
jgi:Tol biopolymer transport system component